MLLALALSGVLGLIGALAPPALEREAEAAIGVICLLSLAAPVVGIVGSLGSIGDSIPEYVPAVGEGGYLEVSEQAFADGIERYIAEEFSLPEECVEVRLSGFDFEAMSAAEARVLLYGTAAMGNIGGIRECVSEKFLSEGGRCEVVINAEH